jgi:phospholipid/cholesterol/gamma-HCH transport system substrate-binding protein
MSRAERREYAVGSVAILVIVAILALTAMSNRRRIEGVAGAFHVTAEFARADGIAIGSPVRLAGMELGKVAQMTLDKNFRALLTLEFPQAVELPDDTAASIQTDGLFGAKFIEVQPGGSDKMLKSGGRISYAQDSVILEDLISMIVARAKSSRAAATTTGGTTP